MIKLTLILLLLLPLPGNAEETIHIGGNSRDPMPPYSWIDCDGQYTGSNFHLYRLFFKQHDIEPIFVNPEKSFTFEEIITQLKTHNIDALHALPKHYNHSSALKLSNEPIVVTMEGVLYRLSMQNPPQTAADLKKLRGTLSIAGETASNSYRMMHSHRSNLNITSSNSTQQALDKVISGEADYMLIDHFHGGSLINSKKLKQTLTIKALTEASESMYFTLPIDSRFINLMPALDQYLRKARDQGFIDQLNVSYLKKWLRQKDCQEK